MNRKTKDMLFYRSFWSLSTVFMGILLAILLVGEQVAMPYEGWINSFLHIDPTIQVDDSSNQTPDVMYYPSDFRQWRWHWDEENQTYIYETRWNKDGLYSYLRSVTRDVNTEGSVLLKNENNALPLEQGEKISIFGTAQFPSNYIVTGQGSGAHAANTEDSIRSCLINDGIEVNETLYNTYERIAPGYAPSSFNTFPNNDLNYVEFKVNEIPYSEVKSAVDSSIDQYGDSALFIISRLGSENGDTDFNAPGHVDNNYMDLNTEEMEILDNLTTLKNQGKIDNIILILNCCSSMQFKTISQYPIDAILSVGAGGTSSYSALSDVLTGKADPNGHLSDTMLYDNYSAPATVNTGDFTYKNATGLPSVETYAHNNKYVVYQEGIYVGYRYYETRYEDMVLNQGNAIGDFGSYNSEDDWSYQEEVAYPFGYGSSYATFEYSGMTFSQNNGIYNIRVTVTNTSEEYSGKDAVQLYIQKPYTEYDKENNIEKSSVELVAFQKTRTLKPGESQVVEMIIDSRDFTSYDANNQKTYILEKGDYYLTVASDSHQAINNILEAKDVVNEELIDSQGDSAFVQKVTIENDDFETYSYSEKTNEKITNQFDNADIKVMVFGQVMSWGNWYEYSRQNQTLEECMMSIKTFDNIRGSIDLGGNRMRRGMGGGINLFIDIFNGKLPNKKIRYVWNDIVKLGRNIRGNEKSDVLSKIENDYFDVIAEEINAIRPQVLLFFTGPDIYWERKLQQRLQATPDDYSPIQGWNIRQVARINIDKEKFPSVKSVVRTHHPCAWISKKARYNDIADAIIPSLID